jgi:hypothetical protein
MGAFGKQRHTPSKNRPGAELLRPLIGIKGVQFQVKPNPMFAPAVSVALISTSSRTSVFVDAELNFTYDNGGFIGTVSACGPFDGTINLLLRRRAGVEMRTVRPGCCLSSRPVVLRQFDSIDNNYQFWGGLRYVFG